MVGGDPAVLVGLAGEADDRGLAGGPENGVQRVESGGVRQAEIEQDAGGLLIESPHGSAMARTRSTCHPVADTGVAVGRGR
jgi:hypothetical protein